MIIFAIYKCAIQSHLIHMIHWIHSLVGWLRIHNRFTAAVDNNLNPLLSINNYCNSCKTKRRAHFVPNPAPLPSLRCSISHWRQSGISGPEPWPRPLPMLLLPKRWAFYLHKNAARQSDRQTDRPRMLYPNEIHCEMFKNGARRAKKKKKEIQKWNIYITVAGKIEWKWKAVGVAEWRAMGHVIDNGERVGCAACRRTK